MAIYNLLHYNIPKNSDLVYLFDTNIWLFLYSDLHEAREREINAYSKLFEEIIENDYRIALPSLIISEFTNVILRADFNSVKDLEIDDYSFKKDYINSSNYKKKIGEINSLIDEILEIENVFKLEDDFQNLNISNVKENFNVIDWNDSYLLELVKKNDFILVSNDFDFIKIDKNVNQFNLIILK